MRLSSMLGLSSGWLFAASFCAIDVGFEDPLFFPCVALSVPALIGVVASVRALRLKHERLEPVRIASFAVLGAFVVTVAVLAIIAALFPVDAAPALP